MSEQNVALVREMIEAAFERGDPEGALAAFSEDVVFHPLVAGPYHGRAGVAEQMMVWVAEFDDYWYEADELIDAGEDRVLVLWRHGGVGRTSGILTEAEGATVFRVGEGGIAEAWVYSDRAEARAAAGLSS
jgi:ketosteroid isomerase-like protein